MQEETKAKIEAEIKDWQYMQDLPECCHGFQLCRKQQIIESMYDLYSYIHPQLHKKVVVYYHEETHEYKVRVYIGLIEFCRIEFITAKLEDFERLLRLQFEKLLKDMETYNPASLSSIVLKMGIKEWGENCSLPETCEGFRLFISPQQPEKINNGSYVLINYVDFSIESDFTIYYNIYRDEFFGEARIWDIPDVNYDFDSASLDELAAKLQTYMVPRLQEIRQRALKETAAKEKEKA